MVFAVYQHTELVRLASQHSTHLLLGSLTCTCMTELMHFFKYSGLLCVMMTTAAMTPELAGTEPMQVEASESIC